MRDLGNYRDVVYLSEELLGAGFAAGLKSMSLSERVNYLETMAFAMEPDNNKEADFRKMRETYYKLLFAAVGDLAVGEFRDNGLPSGEYKNAYDAWQIAILARINFVKLLATKCVYRRLHVALLHETALNWAQTKDEDVATRLFSWILEGVDGGRLWGFDGFLRKVSTNGNWSRILIALDLALRIDRDETSYLSVRGMRHEIVQVLRHALVNSAPRDRADATNGVISSLFSAKSDLSVVIGDEVDALVKADNAMHVALDDMRHIVVDALLNKGKEERETYWVEHRFKLSYKGRIAIFVFEIPKGRYEQMGDTFWRNTCQKFILRFSGIDLYGSIEGMRIEVFLQADDAESLRDAEQLRYEFSKKK